VRVHDGSHTDVYFCHIGEEEDKEVIWVLPVISTLQK